MKMTTNTPAVGGVTIVDISGQIVLGEESISLSDLAKDLIGKGHRNVRLPLEPVEFERTGAKRVWSAKFAMML
jgi:hypothetical protein